MYVASDLTSAARRIRFETGLDSYPGGEHKGFGTHNRVVPLGSGQYLEIMAVANETVARNNPAGQRILEWVREGGGLRAWCLATDDLDAVAKRLDMPLIPWTRVRPDGGELRWRLVGAERAMADPSLPFFIEWDCPPDDHPAAAAVDHAVEPLGIAWLEIGGDDERIARWTGGADLPIRVVDADEGPRALAVATADGEIVLT